jgi:fermentation-respiration switch protein FrsA (DUF1100 family)
VGILWRHGMDGKQGEDVIQSQLDEAAIDRTNEARGEPVRWTQVVPATEEQAGAFPPKSLFREAFYYYRTPRGEHPRSANKWVARSVDQIAQYDSYALIHMISPRPLLMIAGTEADTARFSVEAIEKAREPKELFWIEGASHVDLYDKDEYVTPAVTKMTGFFREHLGDHR